MSDNSAESDATKSVEVETAPIKYVFLDVVEFSKGRSVEAQSDIVAQLNRIVLDALNYVGIKEEERILLPTGDGMCIALIDINRPYDAHLKIACQIITSVHKYNQTIFDDTRQFQVRVGINENLDNLVIDINGRRNVAGAGVNMAQRIMNAAGGSQVFISHSVFEQLSAREKYMYSFREAEIVAKHRVALTVYRYVDDAVDGLDADTSQSVISGASDDAELSTLMAYYFAYAIKNKNLFYKNRTSVLMDRFGIILLFYLAQDAEEMAKVGLYGRPDRKTWGTPTTTIDEQYKHYHDLDGRVILDLSRNIIDKYLKPLQQFFETSQIEPLYVFINDKGVQLLKSEYPDIWAQFDLDAETTVSNETQTNSAPLDTDVAS